MPKFNKEAFMRPVGMPVILATRRGWLIPVKIVSNRYPVYEVIPTRREPDDRGIIRVSAFDPDMSLIYGETEFDTYLEQFDEE